MAAAAQIDRRRVCAGALIGLFATGACATIVRGPYLELADAGLAATLAAAGITNKLALDYRRAGIWAEISASIAACQGSEALALAKGCLGLVPVPPSEAGDETAETESLVALVAQFSARANAFSALGEAYKELKLEVEYDARAEMQKALDEATESLTGLSALLQPSLGPLVLAQTVQAGVPVVGGLIAQSEQRRRLQNANLSLEQLLSRFIQLLELDSSAFDAVFHEIVENQVAALEALISAGLISPAAVISEIALELGGSVVPELPEDPRMARAVAITVIRERAALARAQQTRFVAVTVKAFQALQEAHKKAAAAQEPDLISVTNNVLELTDFVKRIRTAGEQNND